GVGQRGTDGARGQTEQVQHGLDGDDPLSAEDTGVHRGQPAVYGQRLGDLARVEGVDHLLEVAADDVADNTHKTRAPHRQHRQVEDVGTAVEGQVGAFHHPGAGAQIVLGVLVGDDARVLGEPHQRLGGDRSTGAVRDVVEHHRQFGGIGDGGEVAD